MKNWLFLLLTAPVWADIPNVTFEIEEVEWLGADVFTIHIISHNPDQKDVEWVDGIFVMVDKNWTITGINAEPLNPGSFNSPPLMNFNANVANWTTFDKKTGVYPCSAFGFHAAAEPGLDNYGRFSITVDVGLTPDGTYPIAFQLHGDHRFPDDQSVIQSSSASFDIPECMGLQKPYSRPDLQANLSRTTGSTTTFKIIATQNLAQFELNPSGVITVPEGGSQTIFVTLPFGSPTPSGLLVDNQVVSYQPSYTFSNVREDHTISVLFDTVHTIQATASPGASIFPAGDVLVPDGVNAIFCLDGTISELLVDGLPVLAGDSYEFPSVTANHSIHAVGFSVPTLGTWSLLLFVLLLSFGGTYFMRRSRLS